MKKQQICILGSTGSIGTQALCDIVQAEPIDMVLASMVGFSGLEPTIHAIKARKKICPSNADQDCNRLSGFSRS